MTKKDFSDEELVKKSLENIDFFEDLISRFEKKILNFILRISSFKKEEAEEILQEVFLKAWKNLNDFDKDLKFSTWIFTIARYETISHFRKTKSRFETFSPDLKIEDLEKISSKINIEKEIGLKIKQEKIRKIINDLPTKYKEVLILKFLEEKTTKEIADILKKPEKTISTLIHRAKKLLKNNLNSKFFIFI